MSNVLLNVRHLKKQYSGMFHDSQTCLDSLILTQCLWNPTINTRKPSMTLLPQSKALLQLCSILLFSLLRKRDTIPSTPNFYELYFLNDIQLIQCLWISSKHTKHLGSLRFFQNARMYSLSTFATHCRLSVASVSQGLGVSSWLITVNY